MTTAMIVKLRALQQLCQIVRHQKWCYPRTLPILTQSHHPFHVSRQFLNAEETDLREGEGRQGAERSSLRDAENSSTNDSSLVFNGLPYEKIPIAHIKASYNNTIITVTDHLSDQILVKSSCGTEGFKNAKKSTSIAGQAVGIAAAVKALAKDVKMVRVLVRGVGPGRQSSIKGIQMGGVDIISITDNTPVPHNGSRPRKAKRL
ncbi:small ribosomal subunit protein uS11m-like [Apostichopus japonicus]|uniref:small ribosomal subunit protein uS11m-like n=1 Tax=Stichopus japonicus TaxID=307972 RepID=UPI003AB79A93